MSQVASKSDQAVFNLLAAAKEGVSPDAEPDEAVDYDWNVPCRFTPPQRENLIRFAGTIANGIAGKLDAQLQQETVVSDFAPSEHYAGRLVLLKGVADSYYYPLELENGDVCGLVVIPGELARAWVGKVLGVAEIAADHEFSSLEAELLRDVVVAVVGAFSDEYKAIIGGVVQCGRRVSPDEALPDVRHEDEYCVLAFKIGEENDSPLVSFVLASELLTDAAGVGSSSGQLGENTPADCREKMLACVSLAPVTATVSLMTVQLSLREVMNLEIGDVLISEKRVGESLEALVGGSVVVAGSPVVCEEHYALQVTACT